MRITGRLADDCPVGHDCPRIHDTDGDRVIVQGDTVTPEAVGLEPIPETESLVAVPRGLIYGDPLDVDQAIDWIEQRHTFDRFRWEGRHHYASSSDGEDVARYLRGEPEPTSEARDQWFAMLEADTRNGRRWRKAHGVDVDLTEYERYEFDWGFGATTSHGERVRIVDLAPEHEAVRELPDFFVLDRRHVLVSLYDEVGRLIGGQPVYGPHAIAYVAAAELLWGLGTDFADWWAAHPQYHRRHAA